MASSFEREIEAIAFEAGAEVSRRRFGYHDRIVSKPWPRCDRNCFEILAPMY